MSDQHNYLQKIYGGNIESALQFLKERFNAVLMTNQNLNEELKVEFTTEILGEQFSLILEIPFNFPDTFPSVELSPASFKKIYPIPHLNKDKTLCLIDKNEARPNADKPLEILEILINKAIEILKKGISKENISDFNIEFLAYWEQEADEALVSIIEPLNEPLEVYYVECKIHDGNYKGVLAKSRLQGEQWLKNSYGEIKEIKCSKALYLPMQYFCYPPFPRKNGDIFKMVLETNPDIFKAYTNFLENNSRPTKIVFSLIIGDEKFLGAWEHPKPWKTETIKKGHKKVIKGVKGFRTGKAPASLEMVQYSQNSITLFSVERADKERLIKRVGDAPSITSDLKVSITGCGSIGSNFFETLVKAGVSKFFLIDKEKLRFENIARHLCGVSYVGMFKTEAVKQKLSRHFPELMIKTYEEQIIELLISNQEFYNHNDLNIIAIGELTIELRLNQLMRDGIIKKPLLFVWVEPFLAAGHAVYINPSFKGCLRCLFDEHFSFACKVISHPGQYAKREAGCQSTFIPYSAMEIDAFLVDLGRFTRRILKQEIKENTLFTWLGDLYAMRREGRKLEPEWVGYQSYMTIEKKITEIKVCKDCEV